MATTTNYSWTTPDDTALVKDGAAAIRSLGTAIDTTVFTNAGAAIAKATVDAKGDLIAGTADNTVARLAVGTDGHTLVADSAEATGLKWAAPGGGGKVLQVVSGSHSTEVSISTETYTDSGLSLAITPTSATSKVLVLISQPAVTGRDTVQCGAAIRLLRGSTAVYSPTGANFHEGFQLQGSGNTSYGYLGVLYSISYLDSPATTSSTTYKTQGRVQTAGNNAVLNFQDNSAPSSIILLEIGA
jgi:hypothetical protein